MGLGTIYKSEGSSSSLFLISSHLTKEHNFSSFLFTLACFLAVGNLKNLVGMGMAAVEPQFHVLAVDDSLIDRKLIERLFKTSSCQGISSIKHNIMMGQRDFYELVEDGFS